MMYRSLLIVCLVSAVALSMGCQRVAAESADAIQRLHIDDEQFVNAQNQPVRFWGVNLVALYPDHATADKIAENLAELQVNLVRPHHMMRPSRDWVTRSPITALALYKNDSRTPDPQAWDRFDYLNAALRRHGVYLMLADWWTRNYEPGDVDVLKTDDADRKAWMDAVAELNGWHWQKAFDPRKMLAVFDERTAALNVEFTRQLLTHVNPYTGLRYADDPQVLTFELLNECSSEYIILCGNRFPDYFQNKINARWQAFAKEAGIDSGDLYHPEGPAIEVRARFLRQLDADFLAKMKAVVRECGSDAAVAFSNLWRGENAQAMAAENDDYIEDHMYASPAVANSDNDLIYKLCNTPIAGKPFIVGELNQSESARAMKTEGPVRSMLPLAVSAYGSLQNWSGIIFFAWVHGDKEVGEDGWAVHERREPSIGGMLTDGMMLDHLRTCGLIFRRGLVDRSTSPILIHVDQPYATNNYQTLMRSKYELKPGWQSIHEIRKTYSPAPADQAAQPWLTRRPDNSFVSDTGQIIKDTQRKQLTVAAPQVEAFSGQLDASSPPPEGLKHLVISGSGFATVVMVAMDGKDLSGSRHLLISRTHINAEGAEADGPAIELAGMKAEAGSAWFSRVTRPHSDKSVENANIQKLTNKDGRIVLPAGPWHECELSFSVENKEIQP